MPYRWTEPEEFCSYQNVAIYHVYEDGDECAYHYTTNIYDDNADNEGKFQFDVRDIPKPPQANPGSFWETAEGHKTLIAWAIVQGWLKQDEPPQIPEPEDTKLEAKE